MNEQIRKTMFAQATALAQRLFNEAQPVHAAQLASAPITKQFLQGSLAHDLTRASLIFEAFTRATATLSTMR